MIINSLYFAFYLFKLIKFASPLVLKSSPLISKYTFPRVQRHCNKIFGLLGQKGHPILSCTQRNCENNK